jgi:hypothetical protein
MMWAKFDTLEDFDIWHDVIKEELGIPLPDGITTAYTEAHLVEDGSYSAWVDEEYAEGLTEGLPYVAVQVWE